MALLLLGKPSRSAVAAPPRGRYRPARKPSIADAPLRRALQLQRFGVIDRQGDRWSDQPGFETIRRAAADAIEERFALTPECRVRFCTDGSNTASAEPRTTLAYLLARCAVTQAEFQNFVDDGGYEKPDLWPQAVWPHLSGFVDMTGSLGPAGWVNGRHDRRLARFPVTGVCFHEAAAYARWAGYRLPDEAEWQAAATWSTLETGGAGRRYPWGDALETAWCNIWESRCGGKLPVDMLPEGAAPNGVLQLIGNVWEWTDSPFVVGDCGDSGTGPVMKSVRGAAFDTYFTHEAAGSFRSGLPALSRAPNVGFRCAMDFAEPTE